MSLAKPSLKWASFFLLSCFLLITNHALALDSFSKFNRYQNKNIHVSISAIVDPYPVRAGQRFVLRLIVNLDEGWHIYAMNPHSENTSLATRITIEEQKFIFKGEWTESEPRIIFDEALDKVIAIHQTIAEFSRPFTITGSLGSGNHQITGTLIFRACDNKVCTLENHLPFQIDLQIAP